MEAGAGTKCELAGSGDEVRMDVGLGHVGHAEPLAAGQIQISIDAAIGIYHEGFAGDFAADQVARLRQLLVVQQSQKHEGVNSPRS